MLVVGGLISLAAGSAEAQTHDAPDQSIGGGVQWALPHTGHDAPGIQVSWHRVRQRGAGVGADVRWWRRRTSDQSAAGPVPRDESSYAASVLVMGRTSPIRGLSMTFGVGPGIFVERSDVLDSRRGGSSTASTVGVHGLAELNVQITHRVFAYAGLHAERRDFRHAESLSGYPVAGVRFAF
jgi:hypothetical protein